MAGIVVLALSYIISHFYRTFLAVLSPLLSEELGMTPAALSDALGYWFVAFALCQFVVGVLLDRIGPKTTSAAMFAIFGGGGALVFAAATTPLMIQIAMVLLGVGCAPILMASVYLFKRSFDPRRFAVLTSSFIAVGLLGNIIGTSPLAWSVDAFGWRAFTVGMAAITVLLSLLILVLVKDPPKLETGTSGRGSYLDILKMPEIWWILPLIFFNYAVSGGLRGIWSGPYLDIMHGMSAADIGAITFFMAIAMAAGSFAYGPADTIFNTRKWVLVIGSGLSLIFQLYLAINPVMGPVEFGTVLVLIGFVSMSYGLLMAHATANIPDHLAGRGVTLVNFFNMGGVGVMQLVTGEVYRRSAAGAEPIDGFTAVFWTYAICYGIALLIYLRSTDAKPNPA